MEYQQGVGEEEEEEKSVLTLREYLEKERQMELEAAKVLPGKFDECTYRHGYLRQPLYVCRSCVLDASQPAAICYACSVACHPRCDLVELLARRHFRCDCGNAAFQKPCTLEKTKEAHNDDNHYDSHNFFGRFCTCDQPYDPHKEQDDMLQCLLCEDWLHEGCLGKTPDQELFEEMICTACLHKFPFLNMLRTPKLVFTASEAADQFGEEQNNTTNPPLSKICLSTMPCINNANYETLFLQEDWRSILCKCDACQSLLESHNLSHLYEDEPVFEPDPDDDAAVSLYEKGTQLLDQLVDRRIAIDGIMAMKRLKSSLCTFLEPIASDGRIVTKEDMERFITMSGLRKAL